MSSWGGQFHLRGVRIEPLGVYRTDPTAELKKLIPQRPNKSVLSPYEKIKLKNKLFNDIACVESSINDLMTWRGVKVRQGGGTVWERIEGGLVYMLRLRLLPV